MGAKRYNGSGWDNISTHKRYTDGQWKTMETGRRWNGSEWSPLWNEGPFQASFRLSRFGVYFSDGTRDSTSEQMGNITVGADINLFSRLRSSLLIYDTQNMAEQLRYASVTKAEIEVFRFGSGVDASDKRLLGLRYSSTLSSITTTCDPDALLGDGDACVAPVEIVAGRAGTLQIKPEVIEGMRDGTIKSLLFSTNGDCNPELFMRLSASRTYMNIVVTYTVI